MDGIPLNNAQLADAYLKVICQEAYSTWTPRARELISIAAECIRNADIDIAEHYRHTSNLSALKDIVGGPKTLSRTVRALEHILRSGIEQACHLESEDQLEELRRLQWGGVPSLHTSPYAEKGYCK